MWENKLTYKVVIETTSMDEIVDFVADNFEDAYNKTKLIYAKTYQSLRIKSLSQIGTINIFKK